MSRLEIPGIYQWDRHLIPCGLNLYQKLWWLLMPGTVIRVPWPGGMVIKEFADQYKTDRELFSSDPNDHYRPWLEKNVGRQGWDWAWGMGNLDITENRLTIKFRRGREHWATAAALRWA